jgi:hypothetical protein
MLICVQAARARVAGVIHKHPIHSLADVMEVAHLSAHDVNALLREATEYETV